MLRCRWLHGMMGLVGLTVLQAWVIPSALGAEDVTAAGAPPAAANGGASASSTKPESKFPEWSKVTEGAEKMEGLFTLYFNEKEQKLLMEIRPDQQKQELILPISIARGAGRMFLGGGTLNFGDQWVVSFQRKADRVLVVRHNVKVRAQSGSPQADSLKVSYSDSVIAAIPIRSEQGASVLVDLADLLMTDLPGMGIMPDRNRSTWLKPKVFPENVELEVSIVFNMRNDFFSYFFGGDSVPDPRGAQIVMHYGLSKLPSGSYKPRMADDRVGHFLSSVDDFSTDVSDSPRQRYITRWNLEKSKPGAEKSPPAKPVVFWIEKTVPREYRPYVRAGILEWNKAFEKIGFIEAIEVRDQSELDQFDPEDIRFNTFRWITTSAGFAMGPSRTNPRTGEILDADIVFDEGMIRHWRGEFVRTRGIPEALTLAHLDQRQALFKLFTPNLLEFAGREAEYNRLMTDYQTALKDHQGTIASQVTPLAVRDRPLCGCESCMMGQGMQRQIGLMAAVMAAQGMIEPGGKVPEEFIGQAIKEVVMHEVGHTLGLRHNFKSSTFISLRDANNPEITRKKGLTGSVMDYAPANFAPKGDKQGDYFSDTIGPYDYWAIEYAYKPVSGDEKEELAKIAARSSSEDLTFGTDEDLWLNPDPRINAFDLGDPLEYSQQRVRLMKESMDQLAERVVTKGEGWQRARQAFAMMLGEVAYASYLSSQYIGGHYTSRAHRDDPDAKPPMDLIPVAKQREAMKFLRDEILSDQAFRFSPELLRRLAPDHFYDQAMFLFRSGYQYPLSDTVLSIQRVVLSRFLDSSVLRSVQDAQLLAAEGQDVLTMSEIFQSLTDAVWTEIPKIDPAAADKPKVSVSPMRRNLQREHVSRLSQMVLGPRNDFSFFAFLFYDSRPVPADAKALARHHLKLLATRLEAVNQKADLNDDTRAHLEQIQVQIAKVLEADVTMNQP